MNASQLRAADDIFLAREKIVALDGVAGAGKTTTLAVIREGAEIEGYEVEGFAPTSRAAQKLGEAGIETSTLQKHLARGQQPDTGEKRLYVLDESSLASTRQMHEFVERLHPMIASCWSEIGGSMKRSRRDARLHNCRMLA